LHRCGRAAFAVEVVVATIGVGLENALPAGEVAIGMGLLRSSEKWKSAAGGAPPANGRSTRT
jgi:hypothetical protein